MRNINENGLLPMTVTDGVTVNVLPSGQHEFLMSSQEVAKGYGVSYGNIREHKRVNDEFVEGKHFITGVRFSDSDPNNKVYWTKRGIVRLGFFIKSERAKVFRDWAEELIIDLSLNPSPQARDLKAMAKAKYWLFAGMCVRYTRCVSASFGVICAWM